MKGLFGFGTKRADEGNADLKPERLSKADKQHWSRNSQIADAVAEKTRDLLDRFDGERIGSRMLVRD